MIAALLRDTEPIGGQLACRTVMGANFLGEDEVVEHFDDIIRKEDLGNTFGIRFSLRSLQKRKDTHILFLGYPLTVYQIWKASRMCWHGDNSWIREEQFATGKRVRQGWYLLSRKTVLYAPAESTVPLSRVRFAGSGGRCPWACELAYASALYCMKTGGLPFTEEKIFTADKDSNGRPVFMRCAQSRISFASESPALAEKVSISPLITATSLRRLKN